MSTPGTDVDVVLGMAVARKQGETPRGLAQRVLHHVAGQTHPLPIDPGARLLENLPGFLVLHIQARVFQQMEHAREQLFQLILGEHVEAHTGINLIVRPH